MLYAWGSILLKTRLLWRTSLAMSGPKRFETFALKIEAEKPLENDDYFIDAGLRSK